MVGQNRKHIYLVGFSGSGKSTVAKQLGARLKWPVVDMDEAIGRKFSLSVLQIFARHGERAFRNAETMMLNQILHYRAATVVATGGGAIERTINRRIMSRSGVVIYLSCSMREISWRLRTADDRPMVRQGRSRAASNKSLLDHRRPL